MFPKLLAFALTLFTYYFLLLPSTAHAVVNPLSVPNNRFGIHIISPTAQEAEDASKLVNTNGDWGYITVLIERRDRNEGKWQSFFDELRRRHLIPLVRIATEPDSGGFWKRPGENDHLEWADFLDKLNWPTQNRYVIVYNEPNQGKEWGNSVDARDYARVLEKTIRALKNKSQDFFVMNAGFDASSPQKLPLYQDQASFMQDMNEEVPGIFEKIDGWSSHSYPNPGFVSSPTAKGRGTVRTFQWEINELLNLGINKVPPIFINETGWVHAEGINYNKSYPTAETVAEYYKEAFSNAWNDANIVAVTPFLLNYQQAPLDHFSFKKITGEKQQEKILGAQFPEYYPIYDQIVSLSKVKGTPIQVHKAELTSGAVYSSIVAGESYTISLTLKNTGQSIWGDGNRIKLGAVSGGADLGITAVEVPDGKKVEPGNEHTFTISFKAPSAGKFKTHLNIFMNNRSFDSKGWEFETEVKSPVILQVVSQLKWKESAAGVYLLKISGAFSQTINNPIIDVVMGDDGSSKLLEERFLVPDKDYDFTLEKPFYKPKTIHQTVKSGINTLDFGELQPDIGSAILKPAELWKLLPFSN